MPWYAASAILAVEFTDGGPQDEFPLWENVYLIEAASGEEAWNLAETRGTGDETPPGEDFSYKQRAACVIFRGIRKVIACQPPDAIGSGTEVTYSFMVASSSSDVDALVEGQPVTLSYEE